MFCTVLHTQNNLPRKYICDCYCLEVVSGSLKSSSYRAHTCTTFLFKKQNQNSESKINMQYNKVSVCSYLVQIGLTKIFVPFVLNRMLALKAQGRSSREKKVTQW